MFIESSPETPRAFTETLVEHGINIGTAQAYIDILQEKGTDQEAALGEAMHNACGNPSNAQKIAVIRAGFEIAGQKHCEADWTVLAKALTFQDGLPNGLNIQSDSFTPLHKHLPNLLKAFPYIDSVDSKCCGWLSRIATACKDLTIQPRIRHVRVHDARPPTDNYDSILNHDASSDRRAIFNAPIFKHVRQLDLKDNSTIGIISASYPFNELKHLESLSDTHVGGAGKILIPALAQLQLPHLHTLKGINVTVSIDETPANRERLMEFLQSDMFHKLKAIQLFPARYLARGYDDRSALQMMRLLLAGKNIQDIAIDYQAFNNLTGLPRPRMAELPKDQRKHITFMDTDSPAREWMDNGNLIDMPWLRKVANEVSFNCIRSPRTVCRYARVLQGVKFNIMIDPDCDHEERYKLAQRTLQEHNHAAARRK